MKRISIWIPSTYFYVNKGIFVGIIGAFVVRFIFHIDSKHVLKQISVPHNVQEFK